MSATCNASCQQLPPLFSISKKTRDTIWRHYLGEHSLSVALLKCTSRLMREELEALSDTVSPNRLDGCSIEMIETLMPTLSVSSIDWWHWMCIFENAAAAGKLEDIFVLIQMKQFADAFAQLYDNLYGVLWLHSTWRKLQSGPLGALKRIFHQIHDRITATHNWRLWHRIRKTLPSCRLRSIFIITCCAKSWASPRRLSKLYQNLMSKIEVELVGDVIGEYGTESHLAFALKHIKEGLHYYLGVGCIRAACRYNRSDQFVAHLAGAGVFFDFAGLVDMTLRCDSVTALESGLASNESAAPLALCSAFSSGNAAACQFIMRALPDTPLPTMKSLNYPRLLSLALLRSVKDAAYFIDALPSICTAMSQTTRNPALSAHTAFWMDVWEYIIVFTCYNDSDFNMPFMTGMSALSREKWQFLACAIASDEEADSQHVFRFILRSVVEYAPFMQAVADACVDSIDFGHDAQSRMKFGKLLASECLLDVAFDWVGLHFPEATLSADDANECLSRVGGRLIGTYFERRRDLLTQPLLRWKRLGGTLVSHLTEPKQVTEKRQWPIPIHQLPLSIVEELLKDPNTVPDDVLEAIAVRLFDEGQKQLFCKFYPLFRARNVFDSDRTLAMKHQTMNNNRVRSWLFVTCHSE